jgi:4-hydroxyphenylpyruvate dioxygenase-like putative hemolysin
VAANGRANVPARYPANPQLADWVINQRRVHKTGKLSPEHYALLEAVGFVHDPRNASFDASFEKLQAYAAAHHGSTEVPAIYKEDPSLGVWVNDRRTACVKNKLAPHYAEQFAALSYAWSDSDVAFAHGFVQLTAFAAAHDCSTGVPHGDDATNKETAQLHDWCRMQRLRKQHGTLSADHVSRLEKQLHFVWDEDDAIWQDNFKQLQAYAAAHGGSTRVPSGSPLLSSWVARQRELRASSKLNASRVAQLESLRFIWKLR